MLRKLPTASTERGQRFLSYASPVGKLRWLLWHELGANEQEWFTQGYTERHLRFPWMWQSTEKVPYDLATQLLRSPRKRAAWIVVNKLVG